MLFVNVQRIEEHISVIGSAHCTTLLPFERDLLGQCFSDDVMTYPKVVIANHRVVSAEIRSRAIKRNNSCILYKSEEHFCYGIVQKVFVLHECETTKCFLLVKCLDPAPLKLCDDQVTHANLAKHFTVFYPPR